MSVTPSRTSEWNTKTLVAEAPLLLLAAAAFLAPLIGGAVSIDASPLEPGYAPTMRAVFGGTDAPLLSHFVLAFLVAGACATVLATRRVLQVPMAALLVPILALFGLMIGATVFSEFRFVSLAASLEWLAYAGTLLGVVAIGGRKRGPFLLMSALFLGCVLLALLGVWEYFVLTRDPTWRIFGTWQNPNALAGMLLAGFFVGVGLAMKVRGPARLGAAILGSAAIGLALALTQSKGAYLAAGFGLFLVLVFGAGWLAGKREVALPLVARVTLVLIALVGLLGSLRLRSAPEGGSPGIARLAQAEATQDQSAGFRRLLWQGTLRLIQEKPLGWGPGSYRFVSARPGLTTQTHMAHNSYLQLAMEGGVLALLSFVFLGVVWLVYVLKGTKSQGTPALSLKIGVVSAIGAMAAHSVVDSDLHYFGTGLTFFLLLGIGLLLSVDGTTPESVQPGPRWTGFALSLLVPIGLLYFGAVEATKGHVRWHLSRSELDRARAGAEALVQISGGDGEASYLRALVEPDPAKRQTFLVQAAERMPTTRNLRMLARAQLESGDAIRAAATLHRALQRDPNNLFTLKALLDLYVETKNDDMAQRTAERLIAVEATSYFRIRALPELVPTETYFARRHLASRQDDPKRRIALLEPALTGLLNYAERTAPNVAAAVREGLSQGYGGETAADVREKMALGKDVADRLAAAYQEMGDAEEADRVRDKTSAFEKAIASLP